MTGDEKYEWLILNVVMRKLSMGVGIVYWASFRGSFFGIRYLYLWYNHIISVSNGCVGGSSLCGVFFVSWYCFQSKCNLDLGIPYMYEKDKGYPHYGCPNNIQIKTMSYQYY